MRCTFFLQMISNQREGKSVRCEITDHPGLSCLCSLTERAIETVRRSNRGEKDGNVFGSACVLFSPSSSSLSSVVQDNLAKADRVSTSLMKSGSEIVIRPHGGSELSLQANSGDC